ncbi:MAG: hypothetical protein K2M98_07355 [Muribaculum sp.]|nr:hypothetical protein [Muribaculum sp.]
MDKIAEDIARLTSELKTNPSAAAYIARGKAYWAQGERRKAFNDYLAADALQPHGEAERLIEVTTRILDYRNTDLINP